jgi:tripartite-type tricarboxylate transporter receptor subunit TctC
MGVIRALAASIISACVLAGGAWAQTYPDRPITMVVAFPPGGADDAIARILHDPMEKALGQPIVIENVGGAGGMIAAAKAARAAPDGYTILLHQDALAAGMTLYPNRTFDAEKDFVTIGLINTAATTLAARPTLPPNNFEEFLRWMREPGQNIKVGHPGVGSFGHLADMLIVQELRMKVTQVPYRGAGPALVDLLAGQVDLGPISAVVAGPPVSSRPTSSSAGIGSPACRSSRPWASSATKSSTSISGTCCWRRPARRIRSSTSSLRAALADPKAQQTFAEGGMDPYAPDELTPAAASALLKREIKLWGDVIRANNIAAQ